MIRNFFSTPNVIGRLIIILLFAGGVVFAGAYDGFIVETQASCCCGGGTDAALFSSSECCDEDPEPCDCIGGSECSEDVCADEDTECTKISSCNPDCGKCYLNTNGRPCAGDVHCSNEEDSDDYICGGGCGVPSEAD